MFYRMVHNKMKNTSLVLIAFALALLSGACDATQIIILNDTAEKSYGIKELALSGDLSENRLQFRGTGAVLSGVDVKVYLFGPASDFLVSNLVVNTEPAIVSFDGDGYYFIARNGTFSFTGTLEIRTIGQIRLYIRGPANKVSFGLENGYSVDGDVYGAYKKEVIIQRASSAGQAATLVDGSFRYTYAERDSFQYMISFQSFGSGLGNYVLDLPNNEVVSSVQGAIKWEQQGSKLVLDLESEKASVIVDGLFSSGNIRVPLQGDRHHVLIESDPEKKITISTYAEEIDLSQSTVASRYSNARAFIASNKDVINVHVQKLGLMPSLAASVNRATNRIAITGTGSMVGELDYQYSNTGVDYIQIDAPGTPLYAGAGSSAVKLTKDQDKLFLSFPKGTYRNLEYVYFATREPIKPIDLIEVPVARTDLPISTAVTEIYLPQEYYVLHTFGASGGSELPGLELVVFFLVISGAVGYGLKKDRMFMLCHLIFCAGLALFSLPLLALFLIASTIIILKRSIHGSRNILGMIAGAVILLLVGAAALFSLFFIGQSGSLQQKSLSYEADYASVSNEAALPRMSGLDMIGSGEAAISIPTREGVLPVKLELPYMGKRISVTNYLVTKEKQLGLKVLVIADCFKYIFYLFAALAAVKGYRAYKKA